MTPPKARPRTSGTTSPKVAKPKRTRADVQAQKVREGQRKASRRPCPTCGADTLVGANQDKGWTTVTADARAVSVVDELQAYIAGRPSYVVEYRGPDAVLHARDRWSISGTPLPPHPVVLHHRCEDYPPPAPDPVLFDMPTTPREVDPWLTV